MSRRQALQVGCLGTAGLSLPGLLHSQAQAAADAAGTFGRAKRVLMLFMWGGPAHQDTWDLKPDGPSETRGEFQPIATNVSGLHISEHFPLIARHADKLAVVRSVGQDDNRHSTGAHAGLTGRKHRLSAENFSASEKDFPHYGSVLSRLQPNRGGMPTFVALPEIIATTAGAVTPGQGGGMLGKKYDPFRINHHPDRDDYAVTSLTLPREMGVARLQDRRSLLEQVEQVARVSQRSVEAAAMSSYYQQALDMVLSPQARQAFDLSGVPEAERWRYGWHTFGQSTLLARRLLEAGVQLVTVYWHREEPTIDSSWDTHGHNFRELKHRLMPAVDRPIAALLEDLQNSGMLDDTLVIWNSEFGRTPRINANGGRDHWGPCNSVVMAGGGVPGGQVFGASDENAAYPSRDKVTQDDIAATIYHLLGVDPHTLIQDNVGRPYPVSIGRPIWQLLGDKAPPPTSDPPHRKSPPEKFGPLTQVLRERARRFLSLDLGEPDSEAHWNLQNFGPPAEEGNTAHRPLGQEPAAARYTGVFKPHFDYQVLALKFADPARLSEVALRINGRVIPLPDDLLAREADRLWQVPLPANLIKSLKEFKLEITAPGQKLAGFALLGDPIHKRFVDQI